MEQFLSVIKNYAQFDGRARRKEYWMFALVYMLLYMALAVLTSIFATISETLALLGGGLTFIFALGLFIPSLAVAVRRLHDTGRSGWWILISMIPIIGAILLLVWLCTDGQSGDNAYGSNPKNG